MHQPRIERGSHRWQRCILPLDHWCWSDMFTRLKICNHVHQPRIERGSHRWQRCILPLDHWCWPKMDTNHKIRTSGLQTWHPMTSTRISKPFKLLPSSDQFRRPIHEICARLFYISCQDLWKRSRTWKEVVCWSLGRFAIVVHWLRLKQVWEEKCTSRESNADHIDGNDVFYH